MVFFDEAWLDIPWVQTMVSIFFVVCSLYLTDRLVKFFINRFNAYIIRERYEWIGAFFSNHRLITLVCFCFYSVVIYAALEWVPNLPVLLIEISRRFVVAIGIVFALLALSRVADIINDLYNRHEISRSRPIKGYLQTVQIIAYFMGIICIMASLLNKSPVIFLSGLGAITAILLLIFRDSILSLVAGIQLTMNGLIRVGDWIEMPQFNADGDVQEIALHSVKVRNWDRTLTVIPAHKFLEHSFKNWRGMQEAGGRRIKRSLNIDVASIRFLNENDIEKFMKFRLLQDYLKGKVDEVKSHNSLIHPDHCDIAINTRRLTNIGTFRAYLLEYLKEHPLIHKDMTFNVRQLAPSSEGLPIEIYVFTNDTRWVVYEAVQADLFDHLLAILPEFGLKFYQKPSGQDLRDRMSMGGPTL
ncbi:MscS mechanosensitive ion channel [Bdellovibrio bacteriovorus W]|nr:MscS mechanosensitive ion channel [Bdellovibrio bacteriovorus W]